MAEVIDNISLNMPEAQLLFNYIPNQLEEARAIFNLCSDETKSKIFFDVFGSDLRSFLALTSYCKALIGNEGGAVNMTKALDIPTFSIFSPWISKESWNLFEDDKSNVSVHLKDFKPELYKNVKDPKRLKSNSLELYKEFEPSLFKSELINFIQTIA